MSMPPDSYSSPFGPHRPAVVRSQMPRTAPLLTYTILVINLLVFAATFLLGDELVLMLGAKINELIVEGEVWRLMTAVFLHVGLLHIAFNSYALLAFGPQVERSYGRTRFLLIYLLSGLSGSAFSFLLNPYASIGASGAIFGLIGVIGAYLYRYRDRIVAGRSRLTGVLVVVFYNLLYGFVVPMVDNWAHIGGLLAGLALGWCMAPRYEVRQIGPFGAPQLVDQSSPSRWLQGAALVGLGIVLVVLAGILRWRS